MFAGVIILHTSTPLSFVQEQLEEQRPGADLEEGWILLCKHTEGGDRLVPVESPDTISRQQQLFGCDSKPCSRYCVPQGSPAPFWGGLLRVRSSRRRCCELMRTPLCRWEQVVDAEFSMHLGSRPCIAELDEAALRKLR